MSEREAHTRGLIRYHENGEANSFAIIEEGTDGRWLMTLLHNGHDVGERQTANLRRVVACWNACEGIDTELLEQKILGDQIAAKMSLIDQRDELLEALKTAKWMLERDYIDDQKMAVINKCDEAIEKATAGAA